jgi:hypothetical protein
MFLYEYKFTCTGSPRELVGQCSYFQDKGFPSRLSLNFEPYEAAYCSEWLNKLATFTEYSMYRVLGRHTCW